MSDFWTPRAIAATLGGQWLGPVPDTALRGVSIDSRAIHPGEVFIAIKGDRFDGHDFLAAAFDRGAAFAIAASSRRPTPDARHPMLLVPDTLVALQQLASAYRDELARQGCKVIAVAGSNGKTTTRHMIHHVLTHAELRGTQSPKSFNNHIGVPLTLLGARVSGIGYRVSGEGKDRATSDHTPYPIPHTPPPDDFVVVEVGTNHPGEIAALGAIVRPDIAVITSIGAEHLEFFGDLAGVAREEASLLACVQPEGVAIVPHDAPWPDEFEFPLPVGVALVEFAEDDPVAATVALPGRHNRANAAATAAVARCLDVSDSSIGAALACASAVDGRSQIIELGQGVTLLNDSYNANPDSMRAALDVLGAFGRRRVAILGDMLELGHASADSHRAIVDLARRSADEVVLIGERFGGPAWSVDLSQRIAAMIEPGDVVLLKASRGMRLERLIPAIEARFPT